MIRLEINPFDQKDILEMLDYAKMQKKINRPVLKGTQKWDDTNYWIMRIDQLKLLIMGKRIQDSLIKSSMTTLEGEISSVFDNQD